jgi:TetR/AcrR family transcriptional regulator
VYHDILNTIGRWDSMPRECSLTDIEDWVRSYFEFMDEHGAFIFASGQSAPTDEDFRANSRRLQMRAAFLLGVQLRARQATPTDAPEALGLATMAMLDRSWYYSRVQGLEVDDQDMIRTIATMLTVTLSGSATGPTGQSAK